MIDVLILGAMTACFVLLVASVVCQRTVTDRSAHGTQAPDLGTGGDA